MNVVRAISSEGSGRIRYYGEVHKLLQEDRPFREFFERETEDLPSFYEDRVRNALGPFWSLLPEGAMRHDPNAYLKSVEGVPEVSEDDERSVA